MPTHTQLRRLALSRQGLGARKAFGSGLAGSLQAIAHLGYVQIDTLAVVERAHHHVLWSRVPGYAPEHLNQLAGNGHIFEYWAHAAAYLPMRDYRFALPRMQSFRRGESPYFKSVDPKLMAEILARMHGEGELRTRDLKTQYDSASTWWDHGPGRRALDKLFMQGDVMIRERKGMEKRYVLPAQLLPAGTDLREPYTDEMAAYLLDTSTRAHGVVTLGQLLHLRSGKALRSAMRDLLAERVEAGALIPTGSEPGTYVCAEAWEAERHAKSSPAVQLLSPFDNAVIHRDRLLQLFGYHYRLESYVPAAQRVHGYFCLPVLWQSQFVGRVDCKAHRAAGRLEVIRLHLEPGMAPSPQFYTQLEDALQQLAQFCGCQQVQHGALSNK